ncbi:E3 ubiquitin ligase involved in syntaxin degradation protein [Dioscorea alata]|uniref:E3 ubiquitin ligase involved in syntaxin degradation protein n=1 Tax=Dioscorea alata TaxID=55571 RepID=A0ACB7U7G5_DIOAL|nr:E3 ubiquitin ligase involved in syntaxin degradation protein [Dioscorea alata]
MSRVPKWKAEKTKVKVVFRLQLHASHIPQPGWDKLFVSFIPADTGKVIGKTTKANVRNGNCKWSDPLYETTRLLQDTRTKKYDDKLYKLLVAMGSSRSSLLGEANINLADYADALKPSCASLPLHGSDFGTILHVTVQLLTSKTGFREFEQQRELNEKGFQVVSGHKNLYPADSRAASSETIIGQEDKANAKVRFKADSAELPSVEEAGESNESYEDSATGIDGSSYTSDSFHAEKNDNSGIPEIDTLKSTNSGDIEASPHSSSRPPEKEGQNDNTHWARGSNGWIHGWSSDYSMDNDLAVAYEENNRLRARLEAAESNISQLKLEASSLQALTDEFVVETQKLTHQLATELTSGERMAAEVSKLKSECLKLKGDVEELKFANAMHFSYSPARKLEAVPGVTLQDQQLLSHEFQIKWLQELLLIEGQVKEIQNKACLGYHESEFNFLYSDFEVLDRLMQNLKQGMMEATSLRLVEGFQNKGSQSLGALQSDCFIQCQTLERSCGSHHPDGRLYYSSGDHQVDPIADNAMDRRMYELLGELELLKTENESLTKKMNQMECYYESLIQEIEENQKHALNELENLKSERGTSLFTISALQNQIEKLHEDMNEQYIRFAEDRHNLDSLNKELEKRAVISENALKRVRRNYSVAVDRLQKDLELLSFQVLSMYETNESLAKQALTDASDFLVHYHSDDSAEYAQQSSQYQDFYKQNGARMYPDTILVKQEKLLASTLHGLPQNITQEVDRHFGLVEESKGIFQKYGSVNFELPIIDEHVNGVKSEVHMASQQNNIKGQNYLVVPKGISSVTPSSNELVEMSSITKSYLGTPSTVKCASLELQNKCAEPDNQLAEQKDCLEELRSSSHMLKSLQSKTEAELSELCALNLQSEVFSYVIEETIHDLNDVIMHMKGKMNELEQQIEYSNEMNRSFRSTLQSAKDEARILKENEIKYMSICDDLTLKSRILEAKLQDISEENTFFMQKAAENERLLMEYRTHESKYNALTEERKELELFLKQELVEKQHLQAELNSAIVNVESLKRDYNEQSSINDELLKTIGYVKEKLEGLSYVLASSDDQINDPTLDIDDDVESGNCSDIFLLLKQLQQNANRRISRMCQEKKEIEQQRDIVQYSLKDSEYQLSLMKQKFESELDEITKKLEFSNSVVEKLKLDTEDIAQKLKISSDAEEKYAMENQELLSRLEVLKNELEHASSKNTGLVRQLQQFEHDSRELERMKLDFTNCMQENRTLMLSVQAGKEASIKMENEIRGLEERLKWTHEELQSGQQEKLELEALIFDLTSQSKEKAELLFSLNEQLPELTHLRERVSDLESQNFALQQDLSLNEECRRRIEGEALSVHAQFTDLESVLIQYSLIADIEVTYLKNHFHSRVMELVNQVDTSKDDFNELHLKYLDVTTALKKSMINEAQLQDENARLSKAFDLLKSEFDIVISERDKLDDCVNRKIDVLTESEDLKPRAAIEADDRQERNRYENEIRNLTNLLVSFEEEMDNLRSSRDELIVTDILLRSKIDEQRAGISVLEALDAELRKLQEQNNDLAYKLSEQTLKTEEFKNLSIHLRELKDKADAECNQAREKREHEGSSHAVQDSLRIAFIKEQCETKLQELKTQLYGSKKHAEEMLYKLQDAIDEIECGKKREVSFVKKIEELSTKVSELEAELQMLLTNRRELVKACDRMKAELECTQLSLDCCKEEKLKFELSLHESNEEKTKLRVELDLVKRLLENMSSTPDVQSQRYRESGTHNATSIGEILKDGETGFSVHQEALCRTGITDKNDKVPLETVDPVNTAPRSQSFDRSFSSGEEKDLMLVRVDENSLRVNLKDGHVSDSLHTQHTLLENGTKHMDEMKEHFKEQQRLVSEMNLLHRELERLKNENLTSLLPLEDHSLDQALQGLERELSQLERANEHLGNIFPLFKGFSGTGNALERVLALELELAESLQVKKPDTRFQSSFLKQHSNEEAVFQSFRDINELIRDMLDIKRKNAAVETELKEMQDRYSQLSLKFAEVEGERQKLLMTLKNRTPKKS